MENPTQEIAHIVRCLTMGSPQQQQDSIATYFLSDASFSHPFCRVPSFPKGVIPFAPCTDSRAFILAIYRYYRTLSPRIQLSVESSAFDQRTGLMYLSIHQIFSLWGVPFHKADVHLTTVLHLVQRTSSESEHPAADTSSRVVQLQTCTERGQGKGKGKQKEKQNQKSKQPQNEKKKTKIEPGAATEEAEQPASASPDSDPDRQNLKYYIASQQDFYQVTDFLKFIAPLFVSIFVFFLQLLSTLVCVVSSILLRPLYHYLNDVSDKEVER